MELFIQYVVVTSESMDEILWCYHSKETSLAVISCDTIALYRGTQRQFSENICSEHDLRFRIFGTFVVKFLACLPLLGFSNI